MDNRAFCCLVLTTIPCMPGTVELKKFYFVEALDEASRQAMINAERSAAEAAAQQQWSAELAAKQHAAAVAQQEAEELEELEIERQKAATLAAAEAEQERQVWLEQYGPLDEKKLFARLRAAVRTRYGPGMRSLKHFFDGEIFFVPLPVLCCFRCRCLCCCHFRFCCARLR